MQWISNISGNALKIAYQKIKQKQFLWLVAGILLVFFCYHLYNGGTDFYLLVGSGITLGLSFILPKVAFPFLYVWMMLGGVLSEISSTIILALIYFIGFFPIKLFNFQKKTKKGWIKPDATTNFNEQF